MRRERKKKRKRATRDKKSSFSPYFSFAVESSGEAARVFWSGVETFTSVCRPRASACRGRCSVSAVPKKKIEKKKKKAA